MSRVMKERLNGCEGVEVTEQPRKEGQSCYQRYFVW